MKTWVLIFIIVAVLGLFFGVDVLITKGIIWVAKGLFNVDWSGKFWMVFVFLIIVQSIFSCFRRS